MSWKETFPGHFERPLDSIELFFKSIGETGATYNREHGAVRAYAKFSHHHLSANDAEAALKHAWKALRYLQPQIAAYRQGSSIHYHVPHDAALESWMIETFLVESVLTIDELLASPRRSSLPTLHYLPETCEVLFCSSNWRIDAIGATSLMNLLSKSLAESLPVLFSDETKNLSPGRDHAAKLPQDTSQDNDDAATSLLMEYTTNLPSLGLPIQLVNEISGAASREETRLSPATTTSIVDACRQNNISVTIAVHAAMVVALQELSSDTSSAEKYTSWGTFDYRPFVSPNYTSPAAHPVTVMLSRLPVSFTTSNFWENASELKSFYTQLQDPFNSAALHAMLEPYTRKCTATTNQPLPRGMPQPTEPLVESVGILDQYLDGKYGQGAVEITDFWLGEVVLTRQPSFYVWTWRGELTFSMCYNEQFYTKGFMTSFTERVVRVLLEEMGIEHQ
ncbi:MAG: hypothetical protein ALECFALPRED_001332 [Alectoria fallacina]|uniref:Uncharacterized protein n=1 Tax=Alectoria fallacina TaxID=1903189 RepID=A0A8H3IGF9_9LECA|nr:MAG: hypothetical protein ALECFALPRED_001332 [Alectoria fallacina]